MNHWSPWRSTLVTLLALSARATFGADDGAQLAVDPPRFFYHFRVVWVTDATRDASVAIGTEGGAAPVIAPDAEVWGTREQLEQLRHTLGAASVSPVTGFIAVPDSTGVAHFARTLYVAGSKLALDATAAVPTNRQSEHTLAITLRRLATSEAPLAEARLTSASHRTVAVAAPGEQVGQWVVIAITPVNADDPARRPLLHTAKVLDETMQPPEKISDVKPVYPVSARDERVDGKVILQIVVDEQGITRAPTVLRVPPGGEELVAAAVDSVLAWRYKPATKNGEPLAVFITVVVNFTVRSEPPEGKAP